MIFIAEIQIVSKPLFCNEIDGLEEFCFLSAMIHIGPADQKVY